MQLPKISVLCRLSGKQETIFFEPLGSGYFCNGCEQCSGCPACAACMEQAEELFLREFPDFHLFRRLGGR